MDIKSGQHLSVLGITGSGKTYAVKNAILPTFSRGIIVEGEDMDFNEFPRVDVRTAVRLAMSKYRFFVRTEPRNAAELDDLCNGLLSINVANPTVIDFDEITDYSTPSIIPDSLLGLIRKSRKRGITVVTCTQRPQLLNKSFLANSAHRLYFYISDYDCKHVKEYAPFLVEKLGDISLGSFMSIYQAPDGTITRLGACKPYDWKVRLAGSTSTGFTSVTSALTSKVQI